MSHLMTLAACIQDVFGPIAGFLGRRIGQMGKTSKKREGLLEVLQGDGSDEAAQEEDPQAGPAAEPFLG